MKKFYQFINEKCISDVVVLYTNIIFEKLKFNINNNINDDIILELNDIKLPLFNLFLDYKLSDRNYGLFDNLYVDFKDNKLFNVIIKIEINKEDVNDIKIKEIITHELNHIVEYYEIKKRDIELNVKIETTPKYISVRKSISNINFDNELNYFKSLIYLSLDTEYNARIAQLHSFLKSFQTKDEKELFLKLKNSETYNCYNHLNSFDPNNFLKNIYVKIGETATINEINKLNKKFLENKLNNLKGYTFIEIVDKETIFKYFNNWRKIFKYKNKKHNLKIKNVIQKTINEKYDTLSINSEPFELYLPEKYLNNN